MSRVGTTRPSPGETKIGGLQRSSTVERARAALPSSAVEAARSAFGAYGRSTATFRPLPDFLVIGTKKGGTTSVMSWLIEHPNVMRMFPRFQRRKSPHYFDINYARGETWYRAHFPSELARRANARRTGVAPLVGEASPYYLHHPAAPRRIHETKPDMKLIAVLREPVSRAYSNYWDRVATGNEDILSFEEAIEAEESRLRDVTAASLEPADAYSFDHDHHSYLARGRYAEQLNRYFEVFDRSQLLVLPADSMFSDSQGTFDRIQDFLGLPRAQVVLEPRNARSTRYPKLADETRDRLREYYAPHNAELTRLLGVDFGW